MDEVFAIIQKQLLRAGVVEVLNCLVRFQVEQLRLSLHFVALVLQILLLVLISAVCVQQGIGVGGE